MSPAVAMDDLQGVGPMTAPSRILVPLPVLRDDDLVAVLGVVPPNPAVATAVWVFSWYPMRASKSSWTVCEPEEPAQGPGAGKLAQRAPVVAFVVGLGAARRSPIRT